MLKTYQEKLTLRTCNCDLMGTWRPSAILEVMQEVAGAHSTLLGLGRGTLLDQNMVWIVTRAEVVMDRYPIIGETITVETFPMPVRRWFFPRYYIFRDESGAEIGRAGTLWALLDINTRRMSRPDAVTALLPDNSDLAAPLGLPATVAEVSGTVQHAAYLPVYTDIDNNFHVNNTRYMDWACNALGVEVLEKQCLARFDVNYNMEIRPGQEVRTELRRLGDDFSFSGFIGNERHFDVGGVLMGR